MPRGFAGRPALRYLGDVSEAHTTAINAGQRTALPTLNGPRERRLPFGPEDATTGRFIVGHGNATNIVASREAYEAICRNVSQADDKLGECLYHLTQEIDSLCQTAFVLPSATPRCMNVASGVKQVLNQFTAATEDLLIQSRKFAAEITEIGLR